MAYHHPAKIGTFGAAVLMVWLIGSVAVLVGGISRYIHPDAPYVAVPVFLAWLAYRCIPHLRSDR